MTWRFDPGIKRAVAVQGDVEFLAAVLGHQSEAQQRAAEAIIFGVEEIAHRRIVWTSAKAPSSLPSGNPCRGMP